MSGTFHRKKKITFKLKVEKSKSFMEMQTEERVLQREKSRRKLRG